MNKIKLFFQAHGLNENDAQIVSNSFTLKKLKREQLFVQEGKTSKYLGFHTLLLYIKTVALKLV
jgi:hypothetical protein